MRRAWLALLAVIVLLAGCTSPMVVVVRDAATREPVEGVQVTVREMYFLDLTPPAPITKRTDERGRAFFDAPTERSFIIFTDRTADRYLSAAPPPRPPAIRKPADFEGERAYTGRHVEPNIDPAAIDQPGPRDPWGLSSERWLSVGGIQILARWPTAEERRNWSALSK